MKFVAIIIVSVLAFVVHISHSIGNCPFNQEESSCASPCGPVKCIPDDMACATQCVEGCVCPPHTCANETGYCVPVPKGCH